MENKEALLKGGPRSEALISVETMSKGLMIFEAAFPKSKLTEDKVTLWAAILSDLTEAQFVKGVTMLCREHCEIYPGTNVPAVIRNYALDLRKRDLKTEAMQIYHFGTSEIPFADEEAARKAFKAVNAMSTGLEADKQWDEKRFIELYAGIAK